MAFDTFRQIIRNSETCGNRRRFEFSETDKSSKLNNRWSKQPLFLNTLMFGQMCLFSHKKAIQNVLHKSLDSLTAHNHTSGLDF